MTPEQRRQMAAFKNAIAHMDVVVNCFLEGGFPLALDEARRSRHEQHRMYATWLAQIAEESVEGLGVGKQS